MIERRNVPDAPAARRFVKHHHATEAAGLLIDAATTAALLRTGIAVQADKIFANLVIVIVATASALLDTVFVRIYLTYLEHGYDESKKLCHRDFSDGAKASSGSTIAVAKRDRDAHAQVDLLLCEGSRA